MNPLTPELFLSTLALVGAVIIVSALLSGPLERSGLPQVAVFLALGAVIGPAGLSLINVGVDSPILRVVATLSLVLVLFTDAVSLNLREVRSHKLLAFLVVGPAALVTAALVTLAAWWLLDLPVALAAILGAALASTDPVLLRSLLRRPGLDASVRQALRLEGGLNDAVLLPIVLVAMEVIAREHSLGLQGWGRLVVSLFVLSPAAGVGVGLLSVTALELVRRRLGVRRDYESIYSLGVAFLAFAAAEAVHGSGFLAAFAAGLTIAALDVELCDCFLEYGETTAEMALLFAFVLFGTALIWSGLGVMGPATLAFTASVFLTRPLAVLPALLAVPLSWRNRGLIAWFGPRGLSSLLLVLLPVFAGLPGSEQLLPICCLVVLFSVLLHGLSPIFVLRGNTPERPSTQGATAVTAPANAHVVTARPGLHASGADMSPVLSDSDYLSVADAQALQQKGDRVTIVDARSERTYADSDVVVPGAVRLHPDRPVLEAERLKLPRSDILIVFCA